MKAESQTTMWDMHREPLSAPPIARARTSDPQSSHEAAAAMQASGEARRQREMVVDRVFIRPGSTSAELADDALDRFQVARRLPEAEKLGQIKKGAMRKCKANGTKAVTWWPV